jgi:hypothetical protein
MAQEIITAPRFEFALVTPNVVKKPLFACWVLTLLMIFVSGGYFFIAQPELPVFYTMARPAQSLVPSVWLFVFPTISILMSFIHIGIAHWMRSMDNLLLIIFTRTGLALQLVLFIALLRLIWVTW